VPSFAQFWCIIANLTQSRTAIVQAYRFQISTENRKQIEDFDQDWTDSAITKEWKFLSSTIQSCLRITSRCVRVSTMSFERIGLSFNAHTVSC
jgi:hypothetical protein